ncbi:hypothetical protein [Asanoa siamensis]|uniref:Integral membrane protein n=1 Tax=Asanoa siamensis TaxID=926357 RepID=A0ABQ4CYT4_9ACTN|nr:hypothetical protein [Asanoa siamensis]GIF76451.1 hypothetical protein Asi02nite_59690 [Asanoa siamensis]
MDQVDEARAGLAEIAKRRNQVVDGASRGRHRGWDAAGAVAMIAGFAALDLPLPPAAQLTLLGVATVVALACFTRAGRRGKVQLHRSQLTGRFWAVLGGLALATGAVAYGGLWLADRTDLPLRYTLVGVLLTALVAAGDPLYRTLQHRTSA